MSTRQKDFPARAVAHFSTHGSVAVLGAGAWGTALAIALARARQHVRLWTWRSAHADAINANGENSEHLSGAAFPPALSATASMEEAVRGADVVLLTAPSKATITLAKEAAKYAKPSAAAIICAKGLADGGDLLSESVRRVWDGPVLVLSGPSFADEVARDLPAIVALAGPSAIAAQLASRLSGDNFVLCPTADLIGVQVAAVFKNVAATLCGAADGAGLGANARAALMSEAMREAASLVRGLGGEVETLLGPAGFGDFALTCTDEKSRNYSFGRMLGRGGTARSARVTREGAANVDALLGLAARVGVDAPLARAVSELLAGRVDAVAAVESAFSWRRGRAAEAARAA